MICSEKNASCFLDFGSEVVKTTAVFLVILLAGCAAGEKSAVQSSQQKGGNPAGALETEMNGSEVMNDPRVQLVSIQTQYEKKIKKIQPDQSAQELKNSFSQVMKLHDQCYENYIDLSSEEDNMGKKYYALHRQMTNGILERLEKILAQVNLVIEGFRKEDPAHLDAERRKQFCSAFQKKAFLLKSLLEVYKKSLSTNAELEEKIKDIRKKYKVAQTFSAECR